MKAEQEPSEQLTVAVNDALEQHGIALRKYRQIGENTRHWYPETPKKGSDVEDLVYKRARQAEDALEESKKGLNPFRRFRECFFC